MTSEERRLALGMRVCSAITALGGLLFFYYSWQTHGFFSIPFLLLGLTGLGASFWVYLATRGAYRDGVLTEEGAEIFYLWTSFENMLRDIAHLAPGRAREHRPLEPSIGLCDSLWLCQEGEQVNESSPYSA